MLTTSNIKALDPKVFIIIINWNGEVDTIECLKSLSFVDFTNMHVVISDNGSSESSLTKIRTWANFNLNNPKKMNNGIRSFEILENGKNLGFTGANTTGINYALHKDAEYILFLNNDTIVSPNFLSTMVSVAESDNKIGLVGCKTYLDLQQKDNFKMPKRIWSLGGYYYHLGNPMNIGSNQLDRSDWKGLLFNDLICGCCMLIRRKVIEQCGVQDDDLFFGIDDVEYSLRVARSGWKNVIALDAEICHAGSKSVEGRLGLQLYYLFRNTYFFRCKYFKWHENILFFSWHLFRYFLIGGIVRTFLGKSKVNIGMILGIKDFLLNVRGECPYKFLTIKK